MSYCHTALPPLCLKPSLEESPPEWSVFDFASDRLSVRGEGAVDNVNIHSLKTGWCQQQYLVTRLV